MFRTFHSRAVDNVDHQVPVESSRREHGALARRGDPAWDAAHPRHSGQAASEVMSRFAGVAADSYSGPGYVREGVVDDESFGLDSPTSSVGNALDTGVSRHRIQSARVSLSPAGAGAAPSRVLVRPETTGLGLAPTK